MSSWWSNLAPRGLKKNLGEKKPAKREGAPETPDGLWIKCPITGELIYSADLEASNWVTPAGFHMRIGPQQRFKQLFDEGAFETIPTPEVVKDPLRFKDDKRYVDRLKAARAKAQREDCMEAAFGTIGGAPTVVLVQNYEFMGGSMGMAAGEGFIAAARAAAARGAAMICVSSSGGARMQEGILSLMQMPRTTLAVQELRRAKLPYIVILADPTTGGVTASYAMLGDVHIAEPGALIGFAGPRVIEQTIRQKLPEGFQRSEFLLQRGMVDMVVDRRHLKATLAALLPILMFKRDPQAVAPKAPALPAPTEAPVGPTPPQRRLPVSARQPKARAAE